MSDPEATTICVCWAGERSEGLLFCPEHHRYWFGGHRVPSVTTILKPLDNFDGVPTDVLEAARARGTAVHAATQYDDEGELDMDTVDPLIRPYLEAWRLFRYQTSFEPIANEGRVYHAQHRYAGTFDVVGRFGAGKLVLIDKKSGESVPLSAGPQTAAYAEAWGGERIAKRYVVQLRADGQYSLIPYTSTDDLQCFLAHLSIYRWKERHA